MVGVRRLGHQAHDRHHLGHDRRQLLPGRSREPTGDRPRVAIRRQAVDLAEDADRVRGGQARGREQVAELLEDLEIALADVGREEQEGVGVAHGDRRVLGLARAVAREAERAGGGPLVLVGDRVEARRVDDRQVAQPLVGEVDDHPRHVVGGDAQVVGQPRAGCEGHRPHGTVAELHLDALVVVVLEPGDQPGALTGVDRRDALAQQGVDEGRLTGTDAAGHRHPQRRDQPLAHPQDGFAGGAHGKLTQRVVTDPHHLGGQVAAHDRAVRWRWVVGFRAGPRSRPW